MAAANYAKTLEQIDGEHIGVMGWSQGGTDALLCAARAADVFTSVVSWAGAPDSSDMLTDELYEQAKANGYFVAWILTGAAAERVLQWCEDVKNTDASGREFEAGYTGPVLAIAGKEDTTVDPEWSNKIAPARTRPPRPASSREWITHLQLCLPRRISHSLYQAVDRRANSSARRCADFP